MTAAARYSVQRFLPLTGAHSTVTEWILLLVVAYGIVERVATGRSETALHVILFAAPFATGTGLLTIAREGQLDLLFGAGATRGQVWLSSLARSLGAMLIAAVVAAVLFESPRASLLATVLRALAVVIFTGGIGSVAGLVRPRYSAGVAWAALRLAFLLSPAGLDVFVQLRAARESGITPPLGDLAFAVIAFPEVLLDPAVPSVYAATVTLAGVAAMLLSRFIFLRAELGGRRSS